MALIKVKTIGAVINGRPIGSIVEMTKAEAKHYGSLGYVEEIKEQPKPKADEKGKSAPKKSASKSKPKSKDSK